ncbi:TadE/TadG family type IV pilus assembly protein [Granulicoccus sp. GXG6511]|uniref:TadE/TadG family type IV pilus assembly protein n=1 Tax=Granulicoccus sp. GXG6511 TaxID=3381351 RepID=UPI003D7DFE11
MTRLRERSERGAASVELVLLAPVVLLVVAMMVGGARLWLARAAVADAAQAGSRAATLEYGAGQASVSGAAAAREGLVDIPCATNAVEIDASGFAVAVGQPARVTATVRCDVPLADLFGLGLPGTITVEATTASALDTYRRRE